MGNSSIFNIYSNLIGVAIILIWITAWLMIIIGLILGKVYEKNFYIVVREILYDSNLNLEKCTNGIRNGYDVYRRHRFGFSSKKIIPICQEVASGLRRGVNLNGIQRNYKDDLADKLEEVIKQLQHEENFDDEKANEIIAELNEKIDSNTLGNIKQKLIFLEAYHKGMISVKNVEMEELKDKIQKKKWITWISGIIGIVGSIASIISFFI